MALELKFTPAPDVQALLTPAGGSVMCVPPGDE